MGLVTMPLVPEGPVREYFLELHQLHARAGRPSMRRLQRSTRSERNPRGINPTTIHDAFSAPRPARWETVRAIVIALDGDVSTFERLWQAARIADLSGAMTTTEPRPPSDAGARPALIVPRELPPDVYAFTGRQDSLTAIDLLLEDRNAPIAAMPIIAITGAPGVGKTALAVHWAHLAAARYPDGQFYLNLRGHDPAEPLAPEDALAHLLRTLGLSDSDLPYELSERIARYRSLMAARRALIMVDNAATAAQVRPLLPGTPECLVIVTSRDSLSGLVARDGARRVSLDVLDMPAAIRLLRTLIGPRAADDPAAVQALADLCDRLPLALRIAAELAAARSTSTVADLVDEIQHEQRKLDLLLVGADELAGVHAAFSWSFRHLPAPAARLFRLLGIHPEPSWDRNSIAALLGTDVTAARAAIDTLSRAHLIQPAGRTRFAMHDLLREYAGRLAAAQETSAERTDAVGRVFRYYLAATAHCVRLSYPADQHTPTGVRSARSPLPQVLDASTAHRWLDDQRTTLVALAGKAVLHGDAQFAVDTAGLLWRYLHDGAHLDDSVALNSAALHASRELTDPVAEAAALINLGTVHWRWGRYQQAAALYSEGLAVARRAGDRGGQARALDNLSAVHYQMGQIPAAADEAGEAVSAFMDLGNPRAEALARDNLGAILQRQGLLTAAGRQHRKAQSMLAKLGDRTGEARARNNLAEVLRRQRRFPEAADLHQQALAMARAGGDRVGEAHILTSLGVLEHQRRNYDTAVKHYEEALAITSVLSNRGRATITLNALGMSLLALNRPDDARNQHESALATARELGDRYEEAAALDGLGRVAQSVGDTQSARWHWQKSLAIYTEIGLPEADLVGACLADMD